MSGGDGSHAAPRRARPADRGRDRRRGRPGAGDRRIGPLRAARDPVPRHLPRQRSRARRGPTAADTGPRGA